MTDAECVAFLQWALPQLQLRWEGFRKVRRQVCKRLSRRLTRLALDDLAAYRDYLAQHPGEWQELERLCPITISRFYRDRAVFDVLAGSVLPALAGDARHRGENELRVWSIGCANGEEPYSVMLAWRFAPASATQGIALRLLASDVDAAVLERARHGCYAAGSLKLLPNDWLARAFERQNDRYCLRPDYRTGVEFVRADLRHAAPAERFHLVLCRNLAFTYFDEPGQRKAMARIMERLRPGGALVIGSRESLPAGASGLDPWPGSAPRLRIYRRAG